MYGGGVAATPPAGAKTLTTLLPLGILLYSWLFFPNMPAARLVPYEVYTVFFLGWCNWMAALLLTGNSDSDSNDGGSGSSRRRRWTRRLQYGLFAAGLVGLSASKEVNIGAVLWLAAAYYAVLLLRRAGNWRNILAGIPLVATALFTAYKVYRSTTVTGVGYGNPITLPQTWDNAGSILAGLFMVETSPVISVGLALLTAALLIMLATRVIARQFDQRTLFMLFLLGQFASMFIMLCVSYDVRLRYWYILIPIFAMLLAFAAQWLLVSIGERWRQWRPAAVWTLIGFIAFFVAANYYNFLLQTIIQHSARHSDARVISEVGRLLDAGEYVRINPDDLYGPSKEPALLLNGHFDALRKDAGGNYRWKTAAPDDPERPYYFVDYYQRDYPMAVHRDLPSREDYPILDYARRLAGVAQGGAAYRWNDAGAHYPWDYRWVIYEGAGTTRAWLEGQQAAAGRPLRRGEWNVYRSGRNLAWVKEPCSPADTEAAFLLHIFPADPADVWERPPYYDFDTRNFGFRQAGAMADSLCVALARLPADYPVARIRVGQFTPDVRVHWEATAELDTWSIYDARAYVRRLRERAGEPIIRSDWTVHRNGRRLTYIKEQCTPADATAPLRLEIIPAAADTAGVAAWWRPHQSDAPSFSIAGDGAMADGVCAALVLLPDYPVAALRTGQYDAGQYDTDGGAIWAAPASIAAPADAAGGYWMRHLRSEAGARIIRAEWQVHRSGRNLTYIKEECDPADTAAAFLLHIIPANNADLPADRQPHGYDNRDFGFDRDGGARADGVCAILVRLPDYPVVGIRTGQYVPDAAPLWQAEIRLDE